MARPLKPLDPDRSALDWLGYELRRWRLYRQLSQKELGQRIVFTRVHVSLVETAQERPSRQFVERCDAVLQANGALLDVYKHVKAEHRGMRLDVRAMRGALPRSEVDDTPGLAELVESRVVGARYLDDRVEPEAPAGDEVNDLDRRTVLGAMGLGAIEVVGGEPWERLTRALPAPSAPLDLTGLEAEIAGYRWQYAGVPSGRLLGRTLSRLSDITQLLRQTSKDKARGQLYALAGQTAGLVGWLSFDLHDHQAAEQYYGVALDAAGRLEDRWIEAYVLGSRSFLSLYNGAVPDALAALERATTLAHHGSSKVVRAWVAAVLAEAQSLVGDEAACLAALDNAAELIQAAPRGDPAADVFDSSRLAGYRGACLVRFNRPQDAFSALDTALTSLEPALLRQRSNIHTDQAAAFLQVGALEESCAVALDSVKIMANVRPAVGSQRIRQLRSRYEPWRNHRAVKAFDEQLWQL